MNKEHKPTRSLPTDTRVRGAAALRSPLRRALAGGAPLAVLAAALALVPAGDARALAAGDAAPALSLPGASGVVDLGAYRGKWVYLDFWASWCKPCQQSFPWMNEMQSKYGAKGLAVVAVNVDAKTDDAKRFLAANPARFTVAFDAKGAAPRKFGIKGMPTSFLISPDGKVALQHTGFRAEDRAELQARIEKVLAKR